MARSKWNFPRFFDRNVSLGNKPVSKARRPSFEALEPRILLSGTPWTIDLDNYSLSGDDLTLSLVGDSPGDMQFQLRDASFTLLDAVSVYSGGAQTVSGVSLLGTDNPDIITLTLDVAEDTTVFADGIAVDLGVGEDALTITGNFSLLDADFRATAESIEVDAAASLATTGDITLTAAASLDLAASGILDSLAELYTNVGSVDVPALINDLFTEDARAHIDVNGATLSAGNITLSASATVFGEAGEIFSDPDLFDFTLPGFSAAIAKVASDAHVIVDGGSITAANALTLSAVSDVSITVTAEADSAQADTGLDAAFALSIVESTAIARITGAAVLSVDGAISLSADNSVAVTTTADGTDGAGNGVGVGGSIAMAFVTTTTEAAIAGDAMVDQTVFTPDNVSLTAQSLADVSTTAKATAGGSSGNSAGTQQTMAENGGSTSDGSVGVAGALALNVVTTDTLAQIASANEIAADGSIVVVASNDTDSSAVANGSTTGDDATGVGVAVAINTPIVTNQALVSGSVASEGLAVSAGMHGSGDGTNTFLAESTSGAGATNVGVAGSLAVNVAMVTTDALIRSGAMVDADRNNDGTGAVGLLADSKTAGTAAAKASEEGGGSVGVGASFALNIGLHDTTAALEDGAVLGDAGNVTLMATGEHAMTTTAEAGAGGNKESASEVGVSGAIAITVSDSDTAARLGTGTVLAVDGGVALTAGHKSTLTTKSDGEAAGSSAGVGVSLAVAVVTDSAVVTTARDVTAAGDVNLAANLQTASTTEAKATAQGASSNSGGSADGEAQKQVDHGTTKAGTAPQTAPKAETSDGAVTVAAGIGVNITVTESRAEVGAGTTVTAGGTVRVQSRNDVDSTAKANGSATGESSVGVGAAVALNAAIPSNRALVGAGATVNASALVVEARMAEDVKPFAATDVSSGGDTITIGAESGLQTGDAVTYRSVAGSAINGLTDGATYYVIVDDTRTFRPQLDVSLLGGNWIDLGDNHLLQDGDQVVYSKGGDSNTAIGGLTDGTTYVVDVDDADSSRIRLKDVTSGTVVSLNPTSSLTDLSAHKLTIVDPTRVKLAATESGAFSGAAIDLDTAGAAASGHRLVEKTSRFSAEAVSGASATNVGVAGALAVNVVVNDSRAAIETGAEVDAGGGDVTIATENLTAAFVKATSKQSGKASVGVGASVGANLVFNTSVAELADGAVLTDAGNVLVEAVGNHTMRTQATGGAAGGTAVTPVAALSLSDNHTAARIGTPDAGDTLLNLSGNLDVAATGTGSATTITDAEAGSSGTAVGVSIATNVVLDSAVAEIGRDITAGGAVAVTSTLEVAATADATALAKGTKDKDEGGQSANDSVSGQLTDADAKANASKPGGGYNTAGTTPSLDSKVAEANSTASDNTTQTAGSQGGGGQQGSSVGVAASIGVNVAVTDNAARIADGVTIHADGTVTVSARNDTDATAIGRGNALISDTAVGAAVAANIAVTGNTATGGGEISAAGITVEAVNADADGANSFSAQAYALGAGKDTGGAGSAAVNVLVMNTTAGVNADAVLTSTAGITVTADSDIALQNVAGAAGLGLQSTGVGVSLAINTVVNTTTAGIGAGVTADAAETVAVTADSAIGPEGSNIDPLPVTDITIPTPVDFSSVAAAGGIGQSTGVGVSAAINAYVDTTHAYIDDAAVINGSAAAGVDQSVTVHARSDTDIVSLAGAIGGGQTGVGIGLDVGAVVKDTRAWIADTAEITAAGDVTVEALSTEDVISIGLSAGGASSTSVMGALDAYVLVTNTKAFIEGDDTATLPLTGAVVAADGNVKVLADDDATLTLVAGNAGGSGGTGIGASIAGLVHTDFVEAAIGTNVDLATGGVDGLTVAATSTENIVMAAVGAAGGGGTAVGGSVGVAVLYEDTLAHIDDGAIITAADGIGGDAPGVSVAAVDATDIVSVVGAVAGGSTGIGAGVNIGVIVKTTEATIGAGLGLSGITAEGDVIVNADADETIVAVSANAGIGGSTGVAGSIANYNVVTSTVAALSADADITAGGDVSVTATGDILASITTGSVGGGSSAGVGAALSTFVHVDTVEALVGAGSLVTSAGDTGLAVTADSSEELYGIAVGAGVGSSAGVTGSLTVGVLTEFTRAHIDEGAVVIARDALTTDDPGILVHAWDDTQIIDVAGALAIGGSAGVGVGVDTIVLVKETAAWLADNVDAQADHSVVVEAKAAETIVSVAVTGGGGGTAAVNVSAGVPVLTLSTAAHIDDATVVADGNVAVIADDASSVDVFAGNVSGAGTASVGGSAGVPVVIKTTEAFIGTGADVTAKALKATGITVNTGEFDAAYAGTPMMADPTALSFSQGGGGDTITRDSGSWEADGFAIGDTITVSGTALQDAGGNVTDTRNDACYRIAAIENDGKTLRLESVNALDNLTLTGTGLDKVVIERMATADGRLNAPNSSSGDLGISKPSGGDNYYSTDADGSNPTASSESYQAAGLDPNRTGTRTATPQTTTVKGVAVTATNRDDIIVIGLSAGGSANASVKLGGAVSTSVIGTSAFIDDGAQVNASLTGAGAEQSVLVAAGSDFHNIGVAASLGIAGPGAAVAPAADVVILVNRTEAFIGDAAVVNARQDVIVSAESTQDVIAITAGIGGAFVGIGGSTAIIVIDSATQAHIGTAYAADSSEGATPLNDSEGARVAAGGDVLVKADDGTEIFVVTGGIGAGAVGIGASAAISVLDKDTQAYVGDYASVDALGNGTGLTGVYAGAIDANGFTTEAAFHGLAVQASSSENLFSLALAGGGAAYFALGGAVNVEIIGSDTTAFVGANANLNQGLGLPVGIGTENALQSVNVAAANTARSTSAAGAIAGAIVGVAGAIEVGVLRNDTTAYLGTGADVEAMLDVDVNALSDKDVSAFALSAGGGAGAVQGSVSVWAIGTDFSADYSYQERDAEGNVASGSQGENALAARDANWFSGIDSQLAGSGSGGGGYAQILGDAAPFAIDVITATGVDNADDAIAIGANHGLSTGDAVVYRNGGTVADSDIGGLVSGQEYYVIVDSSDPARIKLAASRQDALAGRAIDIELDRVATTGNDHTLTTSTVGAMGSAAGSAAMLAPPADRASATANAANTVTGTTAYIGRDAVVTAGRDINVQAEEDLDYFGLAGGAAVGGVSFGGSIEIVCIGGNTEAYIDGGADIYAGATSGDVLVHAEQTSNLLGLAVAGQGGGFSLGAQVVVLTDVSEQSAYITDTASILRGDTVTVEAVADRDAQAFAFGAAFSSVSAGFSVAVVDLGGATVAYLDGDVGQGSDSLASLTVAATSDVTAKADAWGVGLSSLAAINGSVAVANVDPLVEALIGGALVDVSGNVKVAANSIADAETRAVGASVSGMASLGAAVAVSTASPTVRAAVERPELTMNLPDVAAGGAITVEASHNHDLAGNHLAGKGAKADAYSISGALVLGAAGSVAIADSSPDVMAQIGTGAILTARDGDSSEDNNVAILANSYNDVDSLAAGFGGGTVGIGVSIAGSTIGGQTQSSVTGATVNADDDLQVQADNYADADSRTVAVSGGIYAGTGNYVRAKVNTDIDASLSGTTVDADRDVLVTAISVADADARAEGYGVSAGLTIGVSLADARIETDVDTIVSGGTMTVDRNIDLTSRHNTNADGTVMTGFGANAYGNASGGGLLTGNGADVDAVANSTVSTSLGGTATAVTGTVSIHSLNFNDAKAQADGMTIGLAGIGIVRADAISGGNAALTSGLTAAFVAANADIDAKGMTITATSTNYADADTVAAGYAGAAGSGSTAKATVLPDIKAYIGSNADIDLTGTGTVAITGQSKGDAEADAQAKSLGLIAAGAVVTRAEVASDVDVYVASGANLLTPGSISLTGAHNVETNGTVLTSLGADAYGNGVSGGVAGGTGVDADAIANGTVATHVGGTVHSTGGGITVKTYNANDAKAQADGMTAGLAGVGIILADAVSGASQSLVSGMTKAAIDDGANLDATALTVETKSINDAEADTTAGGVAAAGLTYSTAKAKVLPDIEAKIGANAQVDVTGSGGVTIKALSEGDAEADADAKNFGLAFAAGKTTAEAGISSDVDAYIGSNAHVVATNGPITIQAAHNMTTAGGEIIKGAYAKTNATTGGFVGANSGTATAIANADVQAYAGSGTTINGASGVTVKSRASNDAEATTNGDAYGVVGVGTVTATATASGTTKAYIQQAALLTGSSLTILAQGLNDADALTDSASGGLISGRGSFSTATANPTVEAYASSGSNGSINLTGQTAITALALGDANSTAEGDSGGIGSFGKSKADASWTPNVDAYVGTSSTLIAGGDVTIQAFNNFNFNEATLTGTVNTVKKTTATAKSSVGGIVGGTGSETAVTVNSNVDATIKAGASVTSTGGDVAVIAASRNNVGSTADGKAYGVVGIGNSTASVTLNSGTRATTENGNTSDNTELHAAGNIIIHGSADTVADVDAIGGGSGVVTLNEANATANVQSDIITASIGSYNTVTADDLLELKAVRTADVRANGVLDGGFNVVDVDDAKSTAAIVGAPATVSIGSYTTVDVSRLIMTADDNKVYAEAEARSETDVTIYANFHPTATATVNVSANASIGEATQITATDSVTITARENDVRTHSYAKGKVGIGAASNLVVTANNTRISAANITAADTSNITTTQLTVDAIGDYSTSTDNHAYTKAEKDAATITEFVQTGVKVVCRVIGEIICFGGLFCDAEEVCDTVVEGFFRTIGAASETHENRTENISNSINFDADVHILAGGNPVLEIDETGKIVQLEGVTVRDGNGNVIALGGTVATGSIYVDDILNDDPPGSIVMRAYGGATSGSSNIQFDATFDAVDIVNRSDKDLYLNDIEVYNTGTPPTITHQATVKNWTYNLSSNATTCGVNITNDSNADTDITLQGHILNPAGLTNIQNVGGGGGDILAQGSASYIKSRVASFNADSGRLGADASHRIYLDLTVSGDGTGFT